MEPGRSVKRFTEQFKTQAALMAGVLALLWALVLLNGLLPASWSLNFLGIQPRQPASLLCIPFAPFVHGGATHLAQNSIPLFVLGWLVLLSGVPRFLKVTLSVAIISGLGTWLVGKGGSIHFGASGVIFGYLGFLLARGWFERKLTSVALAIGVAFFYFGTVLSLFEFDAGVSWSGHFFGFAGGFLTAWWMFHKPKPEPHALADTGIE